MRQKVDRPSGPLFSSHERHDLGCEYRFYFRQVELCDNLVFRGQAVLDALHDQLLGSSRKFGSPDQIAVVFGQGIARQHKGRPPTKLDDPRLGQPVLRALFKHSVLKAFAESLKAWRICRRCGSGFPDR